ncbi:hypothetical protein ACFU53_39155 [Streptomyces sp. NPDC057474]|uniref:hypothetical protein n=1 Tax=Streptomyces sp. NPDC057474 TaxID=3346144 RepID=UPI003685E1C7
MPQPEQPSTATTRLRPITTRHNTLTTRTAAMLEGAGHLHAYLTPSDDVTST